MLFINAYYFISIKCIEDTTTISFHTFKNIWSNNSYYLEFFSGFNFHYVITHSNIRIVICRFIQRVIL